MFAGHRRCFFFGVLFSSVVLGTSSNVVPDIKSLNDLNTFLRDSASNVNNMRKIGFLSQGNFHAVQNELADTVEAVIYQNAEEMYAAVDAGEVLAGLISGTVDDPEYEFNVFTSEQISIRAMLVKPNNDAVSYYIPQ